MKLFNIIISLVALYKRRGVGLGGLIELFLVFHLHVCIILLEKEDDALEWGFFASFMTGFRGPFGSPLIKEKKESNKVKKRGEEKIRGRFDIFLNSMRELWSSKKGREMMVSTKSFQVFYGTHPNG